MEETQNTPQAINAADIVINYRGVSISLEALLQIMLVDAGEGKAATFDAVVTRAVEEYQKQQAEVQAEEPEAVEEAAE